MAHGYWVVSIVSLAHPFLQFPLSPVEIEEGDSRPLSLSLSHANLPLEISVKIPIEALTHRLPFVGQGLVQSIPRRNKPVKKDPITAVEETEILVSDAISVEKSNLAVKEADGTALDVSSAENSKFAIRDSPGFRNVVGAVLVKQFKGFEDGDFTLSNIECSEIRLKGRFRALFVHRLKNCWVFVGPVLGSILIEEAEGCLFMLASHQIRIHHAKATDFYLRVRSRPIIEDCSNVRFAPYLLVYEGIEVELKESGLTEDNGNWANADDFRWLRAVQSPNWCILPAEEQVCTINISDSENEEN